VVAIKDRGRCAISNLCGAAGGPSAGNVEEAGRACAVIGKKYCCRPYPSSCRYP
jgi:hypothetical protein